MVSEPASCFSKKVPANHANDNNEQYCYVALSLLFDTIETLELEFTRLLLPDSNDLNRLQLPGGRAVMKTFLKDNWIPVAISVSALVVATAIGLVPVLRSPDDGTLKADAALEQRVSELEKKVAELAGASPPSDPEAGKGVDPALRAEIDQIVKGLVNQTGRISRLKKDVAPILAWGDTPPVPDRIEQQIKLINTAFLKQTGRIKALEQEVAPVSGNSAAVDRISLQVKNLESAVTQLHKRLRKLSAELEASAANQDTLSPETLQSIETKLEDILKSVRAQ